METKLGKGLVLVLLLTLTLTLLASAVRGESQEAAAMSEPYIPLLELALALILARTLGNILQKKGIPTIIGEIGAGIILAGAAIALANNGYDILNFHAEGFKVFGYIGIIYLMFISGFEINVSQMKELGTESAAIAVGGVVVPFIAGYYLAGYMGYDNPEAMILGTMLVATSIGISARTLLDMGVIHTDVGAAVIGAAVIDDVIGIVILTFVTGTHSDTVVFGLRIPFMLVLILSIIVFFVVTIIISIKFLGRFLNLSQNLFHMPATIISLILSICFIFAAFARALDVAAITGAFIAGMGIRAAAIPRKFENEIRTIGYSLFIPLYFVMIGTELDLGVFTEVNILGIAGIVALVAIVTKLLGSGLGARISGFNGKDSLRVGVCMTPRLEMILVVVTTAISHNILSSRTAHEFLSIAIITAIITTFATAMLLRITYRKSRGKG